MTDAVIHDPNGVPAVVEAADAERIVVRLSNGTAVHLPAGLAIRLDDGSYRSEVSFAALGTDRQTLAEVEEHIDVRTVVRETGRVQARTVTETEEVPVDADGWRETVDIERRPLNRPVDAVASVRVEDDVTIIPVYEEVLVVHKQLVLREEVHLTTRRDRVSGPECVTIRRQRVEVERLPPPDLGDGSS